MLCSQLTWKTWKSFCLRVVSGEVEPAVQMRGDSGNEAEDPDEDEDSADQGRQHLGGDRSLVMRPSISPSCSKAAQLVPAVYSERGAASVRYDASSSGAAEGDQISPRRPKEDLDHGRVELRTDGFAQAAAGLLDRQALPVRPVGRHCVERVADRMIRASNGISSPEIPSG
jgi:hypothetical protein